MARESAELVDSLVNGYRNAQIVFTANRLGVFAALAPRPLDTEELAAAIEAHPRGARILADALVSLGLLAKEGGRYRNAPAAEEVLLPEAPGSRCAQLLHGAKLYERWAGLYDAVRTGAPVGDERVDPRLVGDAATFARAMADVGRSSAGPTVDALDLDGAATVLDVGGGPGLYAIELARRWPRVTTTVLDTAETLVVARENVRRAGLEDRVLLRPGDAFTDELGGPYDLIFTSNFVHIFAAEANRELVARCAAALAPGGRLAIKDFFLDPDRTSPAGGALFAVNMLVSTEGGDCYTTAEMEEWLTAAGLTTESLTDLTPQSRLLVARKPG